MSDAQQDWITAVPTTQRLSAATGAQAIAANDDAALCLRVRPWRRLMLAIACLVPMFLMLAGLLGQRETLSWSQALAVASCLGFVLVFGWLFTRLYSLGSVELDTVGVSQAYLRPTGVQRRKLRWEQVQRVSYRGATYRFHAADGSIMELGTMLLPEAEVTVHALRQCMPQRLLTQLGLRRH